MYIKLDFMYIQQIKLKENKRNHDITVVLRCQCRIDLTEMYIQSVTYTVENVLIP